MCTFLTPYYFFVVPFFFPPGEYEYVANYKVLQGVFDSQQITKYVDVARLVKGKFQGQTKNKNTTRRTTGELTHARAERWICWV